MSGARSVMIVGECRVESVSNGFSLVHPLLWKSNRSFEVIGWAFSTLHNGRSCQLRIDYLIEDE